MTRTNCLYSGQWGVAAVLSLNEYSRTHHMGDDTSYFLILFPNYRIIPCPISSAKIKLNEDWCHDVILLTFLS
jgi:hypothetical protein